MANWWPVLKGNYNNYEQQNPFVTLYVLHFVHNAFDAVVEPYVHLMLLWNHMYTWCCCRTRCTPDAVVEPDVHLMLLWNQMYTSCCCGTRCTPDALWNQMYKQLLISATAHVQAGVAAEWLAPSWPSMAQVVTKPLHRSVSKPGLKKGKTWT